MGHAGALPITPRSLPQERRRPSRGVGVQPQSDTGERPAASLNRERSGPILPPGRVHSMSHQRCNHLIYPFDLISLIDLISTPILEDETMSAIIIHNSKLAIDN